MPLRRCRQRRDSKLTRWLIKGAARKYATKKEASTRLGALTVKRQISFFFPTYFFMPRRQLKCRLSQIVPEAAAYYHLFKSDNAHLWPTLSLSLPPSPLSCSLGLNASAKLNDNIFDTDSCQLTVCSACHGNLSSLPKCLVRSALSPSPSLSLTYTLTLTLLTSDAISRHWAASSVV